MTRRSGEMGIMTLAPPDFSDLECMEYFKPNETVTFFILLASFMLALEYLVPPQRLGPNSGQ